MFSFPSLVCSLSLLRQTQFWDCWATLYLGLCQCPLRKSHVGDDLFLAEPWKLPGKKISLLSSSTSSLFQSCTCQEKKVSPMSNMKLLLCNPCPLPPYGVTCHYQEEFDPIIFAAELQTVVLNFLFTWPQSWKKPGFLSFLWGPDTLLAQNRGPCFVQG